MDSEVVLASFCSRTMFPKFSGLNGNQVFVHSCVGQQFVLGSAGTVHLSFYCGQWERNGWFANMAFRIASLPSQMPLCKVTLCPLIKQGSVFLSSLNLKLTSGLILPDGTFANATQQLSEKYSYLGACSLATGNQRARHWKKPELTSWRRRNHLEREANCLSCSG